MLTGVLIGPTLHWVNPDLFRGATHGFGALAIILILFEGGMDLKVREVFRNFVGGTFLSLFCYLLTMTGVALLCTLALHLPPVQALLVGATVGCSSSSIVLPVLQQVNMRRPVKITLLVESSLGDALAVLAVSTLLQVSAGNTTSPQGIGWHLVLSLSLGIACGLVAGMIWTRLLPVLSDQPFWHVLTLAAVLLVYSGVSALEGNELVAVLVFGITVTNFPITRQQNPLASKLPHAQLVTLHRLERTREEQMLTFHGELAFLIRTFFFVLIGAVVRFEGLRKNALLALGCVGVIVLARLAALQTGRWAWPTFTSQERELMIWFVPRGLITAVLALAAREAVGPPLEFMPSLGFAVILLTNMLLLVGTIRAKRSAGLGRVDPATVVAPPVTLPA
jgi:potassium/hydrogen antiporter